VDFLPQATIREKLPWVIIRQFILARRSAVPEWEYAQADPSDELAQLSFYSMKKKQGGREIEFRITVREYAEQPPSQHSRFFAEADKQVNQKTAAIVPTGWGHSVLEALSDCIRMIRQFPYEDS
jgi:hypothetical protein